MILKISIKKKPHMRHIIIKTAKNTSTKGSKRDTWLVDNLINKWCVQDCCIKDWKPKAIYITTRRKVYISHFKSCVIYFFISTLPNLVFVHLSLIKNGFWHYELQFNPSLPLPEWIVYCWYMYMIVHVMWLLRRHLC